LFCDRRLSRKGQRAESGGFPARSRHDGLSEPGLRAPCYPSRVTHYEIERVTSDSLLYFWRDLVVMAVHGDGLSDETVRVVRTARQRAGRPVGLVVAIGPLSPRPTLELKKQVDVFYETVASDVVCSSIYVELTGFAGSFFLSVAAGLISVGSKHVPSKIVGTAEKAANFLCANGAGQDLSVKEVETAIQEICAQAVADSEQHKAPQPTS